jgi:organic radical activating enzyme
MTKPVLPFVETMITQACNLSCHGCTNYSDINHHGYVSWKQGKEQIAAWLERIDILDFGIMGGEPLLNPQVRDWITGTRELMPKAQIRFTTNGLLLEKNLDIVDLLHNIGNCVFKITVHQQDNIALEEIIRQIQSKYVWETITEHGVTRFRTSNNFRLHIKRPDIFYKTYQGVYSNMLPHNNDPIQAFQACIQQSCPLLYKGKIYKCSTSGLLEDTLDKFSNPNYEQWKPFILPGISLDCTEKELETFLENFNRPNKICRMCPTTQDTPSILKHRNYVTLKKIRHD